MNSDKKGIMDYYNAIANEFADEWYANESLLPVLKKFMSYLNPNPSILDLGCGAGYETMRLQKLGANAVGVDFSEEPIKIAREKNPDCKFEVMDFRALPDTLGKFDGIIAVASLIHVSDSDLNLTFQNMRKILKPDGLVMIVIIEGQGISEERSKINKDGILYDRTFYLHSKMSLNETAQSTGFRYFTELELDQNSSSYGWKCYLYQAL